MLPIFPPAQTASATPTPADQAKRLDEAQALLTANMKGGFSYDSKTTYLQAVQHQPGLLKAWDLTEGKAWAPELMRHRNEMRIGLAWRLMDSSKMKVAITPYETATNLTTKEEAYAFMSAGLIGETDLFLKLGQDIASKGGLEGFHRRALADITFFDFAAMYRALREKPDLLPLKGSHDQSFTVRNIQVRLGSTSGSGSQARALINLIKTQADDQWHARPDSVVSFLRVGTAAHWAEAPSSPPYTGFISADRIFMEGYLENDTPGDSGVQVQTFDMKRQSPDSLHWSGNNTIQGFTPDKDGKLQEALKIVLNYQWDLVPENGK